MNNILITVYGSLKRGKYNHDLLSNATYTKDTTVKGTLYQVSSYPALLEEGEQEYHAESYLVDLDTFNRIDQMEIGAGYKRVDVDNHIVYYADTFLAEYCKENKQVIDNY